MDKMILVSVFGMMLAPAAAQAASDSAFRQTYRARSVAQCTAPAAKTNQDISRTCGCMVDIYMKGKTVAQLKAKQPGGAEMDPIVDRCYKSHPPMKKR